MKISIRRAVPEDAANISDLCFRSKQSNGYDQAFMEACRDELTYCEGDLINMCFWVAEANRILGCAALGAGQGARNSEVRSFFIDPACQRQGVGKKLWQVMLAEAKNRSYTRLHLDADPFAVPFYLALGFSVYDQSPSGSIPGRMLPKMELLLPVK